MSLIPLLSLIVALVSLFAGFFFKIFSMLRDADVKLSSLTTTVSNHHVHSLADLQEKVGTHNKILGEHSTILSGHTLTLDNQTETLTKIDSKLDEMNGKITEHLINHNRR